MHNLQRNSQKPKGNIDISIKAGLEGCIALILRICNCVALNKVLQQQLLFYGNTKYLQFTTTMTRIFVPFTSIKIVSSTPFLQFKRYFLS